MLICVLMAGSTPSSPGLGGGGTPSSSGQGVPHPVLDEGTPSRPGMVYPPLFQTWDGIPPSGPGIGYTLSRPGMEYPPALKVWTDTQSETITFPRPSDAGSNDNPSKSWQICQCCQVITLVDPRERKGRALQGPISFIFLQFWENRNNLAK